MWVQRRVILHLKAYGGRSTERGILEGSTWGRFDAPSVRRRREHDHSGSHGRAARVVRGYANARGAGERRRETRMLLASPRRVRMLEQHGDVLRRKRKPELRVLRAGGEE